LSLAWFLLEESRVVKSMAAPCQVCVPITSDGDIIVARQKGRSLAAELGFSATDVVRIATAISELARNVLSYARCGEIRLQALNSRSRHGIVIVASDHGPGIADVEQALQDAYSTSGGLGLGLPGVRRLMDEFTIESAVGRGTTVSATKWRQP
jgi:serine/threonine-protein kinase RsbT